jgi:sphinganine-1-phosphate aldolase
MKYESEVVAMSASLVNGGDSNVCGCTTSVSYRFVIVFDADIFVWLKGGTESIILAIKAHRDYYRDYYGITEPELIACVSAHAAVDKACDLMNIKLIHVPFANDDTYQIRLSAVRRNISKNTILIYGSAPSYPQGVIDPISELGEIAVQYNVGLHVDCCLGGFVLPFMKQLGYDVPGN